MIFRDETSGSDLRLSQVEAQQASLLYESLVEDGRGRVIFISGEKGAGKTDILQVLADTLRKARPQPLLVAGRFQDGKYFPWDIGRKKPFLTGRAIEPTGANLSLLAQLIPLEFKFAAGLIAQLLQAWGATQQFFSKYKERDQRQFSESDFENLICNASREQPLIYLFDDLHKADLNWKRLFLDVAKTGVYKSPVLIFLTLDEAEQPGKHQEGESYLLYLVRELIKEELADWWPVKPLSRDDVAAWLRQYTPGMADHLRGLTGGNPQLTISLFKDWQDRKIVLFSEREDKWIWGPDGPPPIDLFKNVLRDRLITLLGGENQQESKGLKLYDETKQLLACAALEGSVFTAEALARVLGRDQDELITFLDDVLAQSDKRPHGIITEIESVAIEDRSKGNRVLWRYSFVSPLYGAAAMTYESNKKAERARALAHSLLESYSPEEKQIAPKLARLFKIGGDHETALHFQRMAEYAMMREGLYLLSRYMLSINKDDWDKWACHQAAVLFLMAGKKMRDAYPHDETLIVFEEAYNMACRGGLLFDQARAIYYCGTLNVGLGNYEIAREKTHIALQQFQKLNNRDWQASSLHQLGSIDYHLDNYESARGYTLRSLEIKQEIGDRQGQARSLHQLGYIDLELGSYKSARDYTQRSIQISEEIGDRYLQSASLHQLGLIDLRLSNYDSARDYIQRSLEISEEMGDRQGQAAGLHQLGSIDLRLGNYDSARDYTQRSLEIKEEIGVLPGQAASLHQLGSIDYYLSNYDLARDYTQRSLEISEEMGDRHWQAASLHLLELIEKAATGNKVDIKLDIEDDPPEDDFQGRSQFE